jgi:transposase-like protein
MGRGRPKKHKYKRLTQFQRGQIIGKWEGSKSFRQIAREVGCDESSVRRIINNFDERGHSNDISRAPRKHVTTPRQDRFIILKSKHNPWLTAVDIEKELKVENGKKVCSVWTVRNRLLDAGLPGRVARHKPLINETQKGRRLDWAMAFKDYTPKDWKKIVFTDESSFTLFPTGGNKYVRRPVGCAYKKEYIIPTVKHGGGNIMVWGAFSYYGVGPLYWIKGKLTGAKYREILKGHLAPYLRRLMTETKENLIFQHDNDPKHTSNVVKNYLSNANFQVLSWASQSADLNPIEHLWDYVKKQIEARPDRATSLPDVFQILQEEWEKVPLDYIQNLITSMPRRCKAVIESKGETTKY